MLLQTEKLKQYLNGIDKFQRLYCVKKKYGCRKEIHIHVYIF